MKRLGKTLAIVLAAYSMLSSAARADEVVLSALNFLPSNIQPAASFQDWVDEVNENGKGLVRIEVKPFGSVPQFNIADAVQSGVVDMGNLPVGYYAKLLPFIDGLALTEIPIQQWFENGTYDWVNEEHNKVGLELLPPAGDGQNFVIFANKPIRSLADFKDKKLRAVQTFRPMIEALGAQVVETPSSEVPAVLERGIVDGVVWNSLPMMTQGWAPYVKYRIEPGFYTTPATVIVNLDKWESLPDEVRDFLAKKARAFSSSFEETYSIPLMEQALGEQTAAGLEIIRLSDEDAGRLHEIGQEAGWAKVLAQDPERGERLRALITKD